MNKNRFLELDFLPRKRICRSINGLLDLPDEILLLICRYLSSVDVIYSFCTPLRPEYRLHRVISDYYRKIKLDKMRNNEFIYLLNLFSYSNSPFNIESLILRNEYINCLIEYYFINMNMNIIQSIFIKLKSLKLIDCTERDFSYISAYNIHFSELENLSIHMHEDESILINKLLFNEKFRSIKSIFIEIPGGFSLNKSLISHENLRNVDLILKTIDNLFILLDGLIPNVEKLIIQLCQRRTRYKYHPKMTLIYLHLIDFTLIDCRANIVMNNIKSILGFMSNLKKLTLSIHDTLDSRFCHGPNFESILNEYLPHLRQFDYTMTHVIKKKKLIQDFVCWPMHKVFYGDNIYRWIHIYSLPWPSSRDDRRTLPIHRHGSKRSVTADVKISEYLNDVIITKSEEFSQLKTEFIRARQLITCSSIDIELPLRISKLIISEGTSLSSFDSIVQQPSIRHLVVKCRLTDIDQLLKLAHQFPHVNYLELLFVLYEPLFICYLQNIFRLDDTNASKFKLWSKLIHFKTYQSYSELVAVMDSNTFHNWLIQNTDLKYHKYQFYVRFSRPFMSIWF